MRRSHRRCGDWSPICWAGLRPRQPLGGNASNAHLGDNARVITDLSPELERFMGTPPVLPTVGAVETESRFHLAFQSFLRALASD